MISHKQLSNYYNGSIKLTDIAKSKNTSVYYIKKYMKLNNILYKRDLYKLLDMNDDLSKNLISKHRSIKHRCTKGDNRGNYIGLEFMPMLDYIRFCNLNKVKAVNIWKEYLKNNKDLKYAVSIDRLNNNVGYITSNIRFVMNGFNSWKDNVTPLIASFENKLVYAMSREEIGRKLNLNRVKCVGEAMKGIGKYKSEIKTRLTTREIVLTKNNCSSMQNYYKNFILNRR